MPKTSPWILVLGAWNEPDGTLSPEAINRLKTALSWYYRNPQTHFLVSGGFGDNFNTSPQPHSHHLAQILKQQGVLSSHIVQLNTPKNTVEEAIAAFEFFKTHPVKKFMVITSAFHIQRSTLIFQHFFTPSTIEWIAAPSNLTGQALQERLAHEAKAIALIQQQGGIFVGNELRTVIAKNSNEG